MAKFENFEQVEEAIAVLAQGHMELEAALNANLKLGELVRLQDQQIKSVRPAIDLLKASVEAALEQVAKGVRFLADELKQTNVAVNALVADRDKHVDMVGALLQKVELLTKLVDSDHGSILVLQARIGDLPPQSVN